MAIVEKFQFSNPPLSFFSFIFFFRCSQPGLFYFTFAAMAPTRGSYRISLRKNRVPVVTAFASDTGFSWASNSAVLYLAQNDLVYLYLEDGTIHESTASNRAFTTFSGFQIGSDMLLGRNPELVDAAEGQLSPPDPFDDIFARMAYYETPRNASEASD
ncbi:hypothetical protein HPB48_008281 [Haemaphysalis longicornis]|uniref:C1q domain-containing protein n=1 Tax=Haemaphysalis longicornis TaxID=44386 RepID=A0A9J6GS79_HAELO|nr:hypothetical protein HPB48_008281 [Haemaphysalis longicornis]